MTAELKVEARELRAQRVTEAQQRARARWGSAARWLMGALWVSACTEGTPAGPGAPMDMGASATDGALPDAGADGAQDATVDLGPDTLPCDVRTALEQLCVACHSDPPSSEATTRLLSRHDFLGPVEDGSQVTLGALALARLDSASAPMPPESEPPADPAQLSVLKAWLSDGMPPGSCDPLPSKPLATTCASDMLWEETGKASAEMNPGQPCRGCHLQTAPYVAFYFSGTVFSGYHEKDLCISPPPADARVEILDESGEVRLTLTPNAVGNFASSTTGAPSWLPYRARVVVGGVAREMRTTQRDGDCNKCHSEQGDEGAPGRIVWPAP